MTFHLKYLLINDDNYIYKSRLKYCDLSDWRMKPTEKVYHIKNLPFEFIARTK